MFIVNNNDCCIQTRRATDAMMMANSTLVVQIFFMMSTFLLAHKLLLQQRRGHRMPAISTFFTTMINRIIRSEPTCEKLVLACPVPEMFQIYFDVVSHLNVQIWNFPKVLYLYMNDTWSESSRDINDGIHIN